MLKIAQIIIVLGFLLTCSYQANAAKKSFDNLDVWQSKEAIFEIPFEADINRIQEWCLKNKIRIENRTKDDIEDEINRRKETLENSKDKLDSYGTTALYQKKIDEYAELLKNPGMNYMGKDYPLCNFQYQTDMYACFDIDISRDLYFLVLSSTQESIELLKYGVRDLVIYFFKDPEKGLVSYAVSVYFARSAYFDEKLDPVQFAVDTLNKKYGQCIVFPFTTPTGGRSSPEIRELIFPLINGDVYQGCRGNTEFLVWKKNIIRVPTADCASIDEMHILYFDNGIAQKIIEKKKQSNKECDQRKQDSSNDLKKSGEKAF